MKELEKTKRISISAVIFLLVIVVGLLTFKRPKTPFKVSAENTLKAIVDQAYILSLDDFEKMEASTFTLIDIRNNLDFDKGHNRDAINVPFSEFLEDNFIELIENNIKDDKLIILYSEYIFETNNAWILLYQLGYDHIKVLSTEICYANDEFSLNRVGLDDPEINYAETMEKAKTRSQKKIKSTYVLAPKKKKVVTNPKKKKRIPEGGC